MKGHNSVRMVVLRCINQSVYPENKPFITKGVDFFHK